MQVALKKPITVGDKQLDALTFDFDALTGSDVEIAAREASIASAGAPAGVLILDPAFQIQIAERASGVAVESLRKLPALDFLAVIQAVQGFLFGTG